MGPWIGTLILKFALKEDERERSVVPADVDCVHSFSSFAEVESYVVLVSDLIDEACGVDEILFSTLVVANEAVSFGFVEKLDFAFFHGDLGDGDKLS